MRYLLLLLSIGVTLASTAQGTYTLEEVHQMVIADNFSIKSAAYQARIAEENYKFYRSQLRPGLSLNAALPNYLQTSVPVTQPDGSINFQSVSQANGNIGLSTRQTISATGTTVFASTQLNRFDNFSNDMTQYNGIPVRVGLIQPIFGFNPWKYRKRFEPLLVDEAQKNYNLSIEQTLANATALYFSILLADQEVKIAQTNRSVNQNLLEIAKERFALGKISKDETLQLEIELKQATLAYNQALVQRKQAVLALSTLIGAPLTDSVQVEVPSSIKAMYNEEELKQSMLKARPEVIAYQRSLAQADSDIAENKATFGVGAELIASFGLARGASDVATIYRDPFIEQQINVSLNVPIIDWGRRKSAVTAAKLRKEQVEADFEQQFFALNNAVDQRLTTFKSIQQEVVLLQDIVTVSAQRAEIANERYVLGDIDITNLTIAQREKDQALRNYMNALQTMWVTYQEIRMLTGYDITNNQQILY